MEPQERALLEQIASLTKENNKILRQMRSSARLSRLLHLVYWIGIIAVAVVSYYYIQPYIEVAKEMYTEAQGTIEGLKNGELRDGSPLR